MIETTRKERRLLKKLINLAATYPDGKIPESSAIPADDYYLKKLLDKKLLFRSSISGKVNENTGRIIIDAISVSKSGNHYLEEHRDSEFDRFKSGVLLPIIVSVITTGVIWLTGKLWTLIRSFL